MYYKYLSKYHYLYRLSVSGKSSASIEKLPIAYSNKLYIYVITPGSYELLRIGVGGDIYMSVDPITQTKIIDRIEKSRNFNTKYFYFILDNPAQLVEFAEGIRSSVLRKQFLKNEEKRLTSTMKDYYAKIENTKREYEKTKYELATLQKDENSLPEGVTIT